MDMENQFSTFGDYVIIKTLGSGFHAKVKLAVRGGNRVAIKIFKKEHTTAANIIQLAKEAHILQRLRHYTLVNLIEYHDSLPYKYNKIIEKEKKWTIEPRVCLIFELAQGGELYEYIARLGRFKAEVTRFYFIQLLTALIYLQSQGVCHRDLKLENLLLDDGYNLKVADFGFASFLERGRLNTVVGTKGYMAPEIESQQDYDGALADVFSAGVILFIMYAGYLPFKRAREDDQFFRCFLTNRLEQFWRQQTKYNGGNSEFFPQDFRTLINGMLCPNPTQRFTLQQCLQHPWVSGPTNTYEQIKAEMMISQQKVEAQLEREKAQRQAVRNQGLRQQPIGRFRSCENEIEVDYSDIEAKYNMTFQNRQLKTCIETKMFNEIFSFQSQDFLLGYLLRAADKFNAIVSKIYDNKYKIDFDIMEDGEKVAGVEVEFQSLKGDQDKLEIKVKRTAGDYFKFHKVKNRIRKLIMEA